MTSTSDMRYLLDTNVVSALVRDPRGRVTERIRLVGEANVCTSIVVAAEQPARVRARQRSPRRELAATIAPAFPDTASGAAKSEDVVQNHLEVRVRDLVFVKLRHGTQDTFAYL
jgi:predicted nucleic acid-binding protein